MSLTESLAAARRNQIPRGIAYMVASTALFAAINAIVKLELAIYPVGEVAFYRALFALITVSVMIIPKTGIAVFRTHRYLGHLQRGVSQFGSMICMFFAFSMMSLGSAVALSFAAPPGTSPSRSWGFAQRWHRTTSTGRLGKRTPQRMDNN